MDILDIFYNYIIKEASIGKVTCFFDYSILFNTYIEETDERYNCNLDIPNVLIPTLIIKNKEEFNKLLIKYVNLCLKFYDINSFRQEIINCEYYEENRTSPEKLIMILLWSNATYEDFENSEEYLRKRIAFLENELDIYDFTSSYSNFLNGRININIIKDSIFNETPYKMVINIESNDGNKYNFPNIKFGICNDSIYFYAIQNTALNNTNYAKKINRLLFKIGEGFDHKIDNYENYGAGNLKDISASFLVALNIAINFLNSLGYKKVIASSILITRWNSKKIILYNKLIKNKITNEEMEKLILEQEYIQRNLTEKFIRTFLRLVYHYHSLQVTSEPFLIDSNLHLEIIDKLISNNNLLNETASLVSINKNLNL